MGEEKSSLFKMLDIQNGNCGLFDSRPQVRMKENKCQRRIIFGSLRKKFHPWINDLSVTLTQMAQNRTQFVLILSFLMISTFCINPSTALRIKRQTEEQDPAIPMNAEEILEKIRQSDQDIVASPKFNSNEDAARSDSDAESEPESGKEGAGGTVSLGEILGILFLVCCVIYCIGIGYKIVKIVKGTYVEEEPVFLK